MFFNHFQTILSKRPPLVLTKEEKELLKELPPNCPNVKKIQKLCQSRIESTTKKLISGKDGDMMDIERGMIRAFELLATLPEKLKQRQETLDE